MSKATRKKDTFIILSVFIGNFLAFLNSGTINIALPTIMNDFQTQITSVQWIMTGFLLAIGIISPIAGYIGNKIGFKKLYLYSLIGLTLSSALCSYSWNIGSLIIFRILQGVCAGCIQIATLTIIYESIEKVKQPLAISYWTVSMVFAPAVGPTLGGLIIHYWGWEALFFSNVPIGLIATIFAFLFLPAQQKAKSISLDKLGLITIVIGNVSILLYITNGYYLGWLSGTAIVLLLFGIVGFATFIWRELTVKEPLLNLRVFKHTKFAIGTIVNCLLAIGLYSSVYLIPLFMEEVQGISPSIVGLVMLPGALIMMLVSIITGKIHDKLDPSWFILVGTVLVSFATWEFSELKLDSSIASITFWMIVRYFGLGLATSPVTTLSMRDIPIELVGHATSITNWLRQAVTALSITIFSLILTIRTQTHLSELNRDTSEEAIKETAFLFGTNDTFLIATIVLICAIPLSLLLKTSTQKTQQLYKGHELLKRNLQNKRQK
ncbi:DHA2 family efflux MFS transporter permease subunit [Bacillus sp. 1P02SD]|uniref:DHA2 family efflux MFS transporter permease subunit n=1 Tax=Bacillus sp. 1P02SD TaxID=3132264 RepID=UPI0039A31FE2